MNNSLMGESWKKIKFSDFVYMQRIRDDLTIFSPEVSKFVFNEGTEWAEDSSRIIDMRDELVGCLKPMEVCVTKSKEKGKGYYRIVLFCNKNLRLYNNVQEFFADLPELNANSALVLKKIKQLNELTGLNSSVVNGDDEQVMRSLDLLEENDSGDQLTDGLSWQDDVIGF